MEGAFLLTGLLTAACRSGGLHGLSEDVRGGSLGASYDVGVDWQAASRACCGRWRVPRQPRARSSGAEARRTSLRRRKISGQRVSPSGVVPVGDDERGAEVEVRLSSDGNGVVALVCGAVGAERA